MSEPQATMPFEDALVSYVDDMWALARRLCGQDAPDVVQEASEQAWRTLATFDPDRASMRTWLLMIVADRARKHRRRFRGSVLLTDHPQPAVDLDLHLDLSRAVGRLPRRQRLAVELHYVLGLPVNDVAEVMQCAPGTVKSALSDARLKLRKSVEVRG